MSSTQGNLYQTDQIRQIEQLAMQSCAITAHDLMQRSGLTAFECLREYWPKAKKIAVFCGTGNNGGDGFVLAELAYARGYIVTIYLIGSVDRITSEAAIAAFKACKQADIPILLFNSTITNIDADLIVDAICGIGLQKPLRDTAVHAVQLMQSQSLPILSLDIPTGIEADTGEVLGAAIKANATITFIAVKIGLLMSAGLAHRGKLICDDLALPAELFETVKPIAERLKIKTYRSFLKSRSRDWHKGLSGHVLIIGSGPGFSGASRLAAEAALRVGAGLVTIATHPDHAALLNITRPEIMCHGVHDATELQPLLDKAKVIIIGPGLTQNDWALNLFNKVISQPQPMVVDADGLNLLATHPMQHKNWVLTPHPGEAARLLHTSTQDIQSNRLAAAQKIQQQYGGTCVLKGAGTIITSPHLLPSVCDQGNAGMATAGMGDVLSGVIGGLLAQSVPMEQATRLGVVWHAIAGDRAAQEGERGLLAMDLMPYLRQLCNE